MVAVRHDPGSRQIVATAASAAGVDGDGSWVSGGTDEPGPDATAMPGADPGPPIAPGSAGLELRTAIATRIASAATGTSGDRSPWGRRELKLAGGPSSVGRPSSVGLRSSVIG
jgi:hypothetical protein